MADEDDNGEMWNLDEITAWIAACVMIADGKVLRPSAAELGEMSLSDWVRGQVSAEVFGRQQLAVEAMQPAERGMYIERAFPEHAELGPGPLT